MLRTVKKELSPLLPIKKKNPSRLFILVGKGFGEFPVRPNDPADQSAIPLMKIPLLLPIEFVIVLIFSIYMDEIKKRNK